jgi:hypothetical protein
MTWFSFYFSCKSEPYQQTLLRRLYCFFSFFVELSIHFHVNFDRLKRRQVT